MRQYIDIMEQASMTPYEGDGPLYHGTDILALISMLDDNYLRYSIDQSEGPSRGISLTTDQKMAWQFADRSADIFSNNHAYDDLGLPPFTSRGAVIELNADAIRASGARMFHYVDPLTFDDDDGDEEEVRVSEIKDLASVLISFSFNPADLDWYRKWLETEYAQKDSGWHWAGIEERLARLTSLPLFKPA